MVRIMSKKFLLLVCFIGFCAFSRGQVAKLFCNQKGVTCPVLFPPNCLRVDNILANYDTLYYEEDTLFVVFPDERQYVIRENVEMCELQGLVLKQSFVLRLESDFSSANFICITFNGVAILLKKHKGRHKYRQISIREESVQEFINNKRQQ